MNNQSQYTELGVQLLQSLQTIEVYEQQVAKNRNRETFSVPTVGSKLSTAYEQLRNASEYAEDNQLRRRAIRRFLIRNLSFHEKTKTKELGSDVVTELTQAGYVPNNHVTSAQLKDISSHIKRYYGAYWHYTKIERDHDKRRTFQTWILDTLSTRIEQSIESAIRQLTFGHFAFTYFYKNLSVEKLFKNTELQFSVEDYPLLLYIAVHKSILKSDDALTRTALLDSYRQDISLIHNFESFNKKIDTLLDSKELAYASRVISRNGAVMRILYSGFFNEQSTLTKEAFKTPDTLDYALRDHIEKEYRDLDKRLDSGIIKSIVFLLITKSIIGLGVEVPYDIAVLGHIVWLPLLLNLFFPSLFIAFTRLTLKIPGARNTETIIRSIVDLTFYSQDNEPQASPVAVPKKNRSYTFNAIYILMFAIMFGLLGYGLHLLDFTLIQGVIFFIFLSTASFLAFRLSNQIRELEATDTPQGGIALLRDILYLPFIYVGQQISYRYSKLNIIAMILDMVVELPLKTVLKLVRQWTAFLRAKKDELG